MRCIRCNGYMCPQRIYTRMGVVDVKVCVNCGNVEDDVIIFNRIIMSLNLATSS